MLKNWRPLSLLNTDYKILTKSLATRLQCILDEVISYDQNGYIKNRFIGENIRTIADVIEHTNKNNESGMIALLDFEKAFDTVNWDFLQNTLCAFNFGDYFIKWIKIFYTDIQSCCLNNGHTTSFFSLSRGVRQGCPISALLFILLAEVMANKIKSRNDIHGITIDQHEIKISQLADDTTLFLKDNNALLLALEILESFQTCSGLKLNKNKTEIFYLGNTNHRPTNSAIKVANEFKALGIYFSKNNDEMTYRNLEERLKKIETILNIWRQRDLSLKGKITVLKSLAIPQLLYVTNVLHVPSTYVERVQKEIQSFVWNNKIPKIKTTTLIADVARGGLKMPHFESSLKS